MKVLVADDDETIRLLVTRMFARRGDTVQNASDGAAAIERLEAEDFDLLLLDLMMPRIDGIGVLAHLATRTAPSPTIVMMTAAAPAMVNTVPRAQVAALVPKPFDIATLMRIADDAVRRGSNFNSSPSHENE